MKNVKSSTWYFFAILVFVCSAASVLLAGDSRVFLKANPAPSVELVVYSAPWCVPCQKLKPILRLLKIKGYSITIQESNQPPVEAVPTLRFHQFGNLVEEHVGLQTKEFIEETFKRIEGSAFE